MQNQAIDVTDMRALDPSSAGYAIKFPFALKDSFRATFPTAKWNPDYRRWIVGPKSKKRLDAWIAEATEAATLEAAQAEADLLGEDLTRLRAQLAEITRRHLDITELLALIERSRALLATHRAEIEAAQRDKEADERRLDAQRAALHDQLRGLIDLGAVKAAAQAMARNMNPADRRKKEAFEQARTTIKEARDRLLEAGLGLVAITKLASANVNRPDRDHPNLLAERDWDTVYADDDD